MAICPKAPWWIVRKDDPNVKFPASCKSYTCGICRTSKIKERVSVATWGATQANLVRHVTLTRVPATWQLVRSQMRDLTRRLRKAYRWEWVWSVERNPRLTGYHVHAIQWGEFIPKRRLQELWGGRIVYIKAIPPDKAGYLAKVQQLAGYLTKDIGELLNLNGGRCMHMSRGFLHGLNSRQVIKEMSTGKEWVLVPATIEEIRNIGQTEENWPPDGAN